MIPVLTVSLTNWPRLKTTLLLVKRPLLTKLNLNLNFVIAPFLGEENYKLLNDNLEAPRYSSVTAAWNASGMFVVLCNTLSGFAVGYTVTISIFTLSADPDVVVVTP